MRRAELPAALVIGARADGRRLARDGVDRCRIVGFVDDDAQALGEVDGIPVVGAIAELAELVLRHGAEQILITLPELRGGRLRRVLDACSGRRLRYRTLAGTALRDLEPGDLLPPDRLDFVPPDLESRSALVTGAGGSIGSEISAQLLRAGIGRLVAVDRDENGLFLLEGRLAREVRSAPFHLEIGDVRDAPRMRQILDAYRPADVFHAAAQKHVPLTEFAPAEAVKTNVAGTRNVATASSACGVGRFVYISTDKAVRPTSVMGATKRIGEDLSRSIARRAGTACCVVRFGNVLGSAGSVVQVFREQIAHGGPVTVTHRQARRYFMSVTEAVALVLQAAYGDFGDLCVLDMREQMRIEELARAMIAMAGLRPGTDVEILFRGLRPGEKLFEELLTAEESRTRRVHRGILSVEAPPPAPDLGDRVAGLIEAAELGLDARVVELLRETVPIALAPGAAP